MTEADRLDKANEDLYNFLLVFMVVMTFIGCPTMLMWFLYGLTYG